MELLHRSTGGPLDVWMAGNLESPCESFNGQGTLQEHYAAKANLLSETHCVLLQVRGKTSFVPVWHMDKNEVRENFTIPSIYMDIT